MHRRSSVAGVLALAALGLTACGGGGDSSDSSSGGDETTPEPDAVLSCLTDGGLDGKLTSFSNSDPLAPTANVHITLDKRTDTIDVTLYATEDAAQNSFDAQTESLAGMNAEASRYGATTVVTVYGTDPQTDALAVIDGCV